MVLTPDSDYRRANRVAERLRRKMEGYDFPGVPHVVTGSFGVAQAGPGESAAACCKRVDKALYQAKEGGAEPGGPVQCAVSIGEKTSASATY